MARIIKKLLRHTAGWTLLLLGFIGLFLPFMQGILMLILGIVLLAPDVPFFGKLLSKARDRHPDLFRKAKQVQTKFASLWKFKKKNVSLPHRE